MGDPKYLADAIAEVRDKMSAEIRKQFRIHGGVTQEAVANGIAAVAAPIVQGASGATEAELDRLRAAVQAVRELCEDAQREEPDAIFSQGGPRWSVWTADVLKAIGEA